MVQSFNLVQLKKITVVCDPQLPNYGQMRDCCQDFTADFSSGNAYGLIGECGMGGWALSYVLSGKTEIQSGEISLDQTPVTSSFLSKIGCYVGEGYLNKSLFGEKTIRQQIIEGLKANDINFSLQEIIDLFELSQSRLDRKMGQISNERWNASAAIGFAHGKSIYCFPWLNTAWINTLNQRIEHCVRILKQFGAIVIIPTSNASLLNQIVDSTIPTSSI